MIYNFLIFHVTHVHGCMCLLFKKLLSLRKFKSLISFKKYNNTHTHTHHFNKKKFNI